MNQELLKGLTEEQLKNVNGGCTGPEAARKCPNCKSEDITETRGTGREAQTMFECNQCVAVWFLQ